MASIFMYTQLISVWERNLQAFEGSVCIPSFTFKLLNSTPQLSSIINSTGTDTGYQTSHGRKNGENASQVSVETKKVCIYVLDRPNIQDEFRTATLMCWNTIVLEPYVKKLVPVQKEDQRGCHIKLHSIICSKTSVACPFFRMWRHQLMFSNYYNF
jgi:hypothetical protein